MRSDKRCASSLIDVKNFDIYLTFDIDQDFNQGSEDFYNRTKAEFKSFGLGFIRLIEELNHLPFSVFLRSDFQIKTLYGAYDYLISNTPEISDRIHGSNGEINWHIHIYEPIGNEWQLVRDENRLLDSFNEDFSHVKKIKEINHQIVRIGECVMSNKLMRTLNDSGIRIDSTALPGRRRDDKEKFFDWESTSNAVYHPSHDDYRVPNDLAYKILEVPMTTINTKAVYDKAPLKRYFNLSFKTDALFYGMDDYIAENDHLVVITHPYEVLADGKHGLISYDIEVFKENVARLIQSVRKKGKIPIFKKISDFLVC